MRCKRCNTPLLAKARFCTACGFPVAEADREQHSREKVLVGEEQDTLDQPTIALSEASGQLEDAMASPAIPPTPDASPAEHEAPSEETEEQSPPALSSTNSSESAPPTLPLTPSPETEQEAQDGATVFIPPLPSHPPPTPPAVIPVSPLPPAASLSYFSLNTSHKKVTHMPAAINPQPTPRRRRRGCGGCFFALLTILVLLGAAWFFVLRPMLHTMAMNQIDTTLSAAVKQIPSQIALMPGGPLTIPEKAINNLLVLNSAPSDPVQNATTSITPDAMRLDFQVYGLPCSITQIPRLQNGQVVATNVSLSGAITLIMSPDDIATLLNRHLAEAQNRIHHPVTALQLKDHEIDLTLG